MRTIVLALCLLAGAARADVPGITVTTVPPSPTVTDSVSVVVRSTCACPSHLVPINRNGFFLDVPYSFICLSACGQDSVATYDVGQLPEGVYTVRQYPEGDPDNLTVIGTFAVGNAPIPSVGNAGVIAIVIGLSLIALIAVKR